MAWLGATKVRSEQDLWGLLFDGDLRFKRQVNGVWGALQGPFNNTRFALIPQNAEVISRVSRMRGTSGSNLSIKSLAQPTQFGMAFDDAGKAAFELTLRSSAVAKTQTAGSASAESVLIDTLGSWYKLPHERITANPTFTGQGGTPALTIGDGATDDIRAEIDLEFGYFFVNENAANISANDTIEATYNYDDQSGYTLDGDKIAENVIWAEFVGINETENIACRILVRRASVTASGELNTVGTEFPTFDFAGEMATPNDGSPPYTLEWWSL